MIANIVYNNPNDKELIKLIEFKNPVFVNFIDFNSLKGRKESYKVKGKYAARANPFIELLDDNKELIKAFYSEEKNACNQFIEWMNNDRNFI